MALFKTEMDDINLLDISENEKELLRRGVEYVYDVIENLYKKYTRSLYELIGVLKNSKEYRIYIRGGRYPLSAKVYQG